MLDMAKSVKSETRFYIIKVQKHYSMTKVRITVKKFVKPQSKNLKGVCQEIFDLFFQDSYPSWPQITRLIIFYFGFAKVFEFS